LERVGFLSRFRTCERKALISFIKEAYLDEVRGVDTPVWLTALNNTEACSHELTSDIEEGVPNSYQIWPFLKIPSGNEPVWLASLCVQPI
jgi:hypothetical protein